MAVNPLLSSGVNGIQAGLNGLENVAQEIAGMNVSDVSESQAGAAPTLDNPADVASAMVELKVYERQVQASAKVVQTADEVIGFLLDSTY